MQPANDPDRIYIRWRWMFVAGVLVGIPVGNVLGNWSALIWLPLSMWAMYRIWRDQQ